MKESNQKAFTSERLSGLNHTQKTPDSKQLNEQIASLWERIDTNLDNFCLRARDLHEYHTLLSEREALYSGEIISEEIVLYRVIRKSSHKRSENGARSAFLV